MMFGLPAACLAMYRAALPERRKAVGGMLLSLAATSFLTGVTEPIEFTFMFLAPALFALHAVLTGAAMVLMDVLGVRLGFGFSAGLFDYVLGFGLATRPLMLLPVGAAYFAIYYFSFSWVIRRFGLKTPGREVEVAASAPAALTGKRGADFVTALGGPANLSTVDACTTRLRLTLADPASVDEPSLRALGARGVVRPGGNALQIVLGPVADQVAGEIRAAMRSGGDDIAALFDALGGKAIRAVELRSTRILVATDGWSHQDLSRFGVRATAEVGGALHLIAGPEAARLADGLKALLR